MILYNIRANGPFEYDKMILNVGQLHNECSEAKDAYRNTELLDYLEEMNTMIAACTGKDNLLNRLALAKKAVLE